MKTMLSVATLVFAIGAAAIMPSSAIAQVNVNITLGEAPPPLRFEPVPAPRSGYLWAPGYWGYDGGRYVWTAGHWERTRLNYDYARPEWREEGGKWRFVKGGWHKGRGHDREHEYKRRYERDDDNQGRREERDDDEGRGKGCPPGQAKKGNC